jgi:hypothetical protein
MFNVNIVRFSLSELTHRYRWEVMRTHEARGPRFEVTDIAFDSVAK